MEKIKKLIAIAAIICLSSPAVYGEDIPPSQTVGGLEKSEKDMDKSEKLEKLIKKPRKKPEELIEEKELPIAETQKVLIKKMEVKGVSLISEDIIRGITSSYEGKELSLSQMQKVCDLITDEYRKRGRATSRAYLPPQTIKDGVLVVMIVEGTVGKVDIEGNKFFSKKIIKKKIELQAGEPFNYKSLQKSLRIINEQPDIKAKAILAPGDRPGATDIVLKVEDRFPFHLGSEYDNFGSKYIMKNRYSFFVEDNNLLGLNDKAYVKYQTSEGDFFKFLNARYILPLYNGGDIGIYYMWIRSKLAEEFKSMDIQGKGDIGGIFFNQSIIDEADVDLRFNYGFDYKHNRNFISGQKFSREEIRMFKYGFDLDATDPMGRTVFTLETDFGIPWMFGGVAKKDPFSTRTGSGGEFTKLSGFLYRLQPIPYDSMLLWKNQFQFSNWNLVAGEQFQLGGIANVRSYPVGEYSGDNGLYSGVEWSFPPYFLPKDIKVPLSKSTLYNASRFVLFFDWSYAWLNNPLPLEKDKKNIQGYGFAIRFTLPEDFSARIEFAYSLGSKPSDNATDRTYFNVSKKF